MANQLESEVMTDAQIDETLKGLPGWRRDGLKIRKQYEFPGFGEAIRFVNKVAEAAEAMNHHPDIDIRFKKVDIAYWTHKMNAVTKADVAGAQAVEKFIE